MLSLRTTITTMIFGGVLATSLTGSAFAITTHQSPQPSLQPGHSAIHADDPGAPFPPIPPPPSGGGLALTEDPGAPFPPIPPPPGKANAIG